MFTFLYQSGHFRIERTNGTKSNLPSNSIQKLSDIIPVVVRKLN